MHVGDVLIFGPEDAVSDHGFRVEGDAAQHPLLELVITGPVDKVTHVQVDGFAIQHLGLELEQVLDHRMQHILGHPVEEQLAGTRGLLAGAPPQLDHVELLGIPLPGEGRAGQHAFATTDALALLLHRFAMLDGETIHRVVAACLDAGAAADTALGIEMDLGDAEDAEVGHVGLGAVVGAAGDHHLEVIGVGVEVFLHPLGQPGAVDIALLADGVALTGDDVAPADALVTGSGVLYLDAAGLYLNLPDKGLEGGIDLVHVLILDAGHRQLLAGGEVDQTVAVLFGDLLGHRQQVGGHDPAGNAHADHRFAAHLGEAVFVLGAGLDDVDIETHGVLPQSIRCWA